MWQKFLEAWVRLFVLVYTIMPVFEHFTLSGLDLAVPKVPSPGRMKSQISSNLQVGVHLVLSWHWHHCMHKLKI